MKTKIEQIQYLLNIFNQAPKQFCNSDNETILTHEDIYLRKLAISKGIPSISNKEMVFRKFNELQQFNGKKLKIKLFEVLIFLEKYNLNPGEIGTILDDLVLEIKEFNKRPVRTIFNPFS
jgi:hypothetical protein